VRRPGSDPGHEPIRRARDRADRIRADAVAGRQAAAGVALSAGVASGERVVGGDLAAALAALEAAGWRLLHDVRRRFSRLPPIDHVAIGPPGVVAVQQLPWPGVVAVDSGVLRLDGADHGFDIRRLVTATTVLGVTAGRDTPLRTVLCVLPANLSSAVVRPDVEVVGRAGLVAALTAGPAVLGPADVDRLHVVLRAGLRTGSGLHRPRYPLPGPVDNARRPDGGSG
jgi:hypothetical protein